MAGAGFAQTAEIIGQKPPGAKSHWVTTQARRFAIFRLLGLGASFWSAPVLWRYEGLPRKPVTLKVSDGAFRARTAT
jgi:hypothetical protein